MYTDEIPHQDRALSKLKFTGNKLTTRAQVTFLEESYHRVNSKLDN